MKNYTQSFDLVTKSEELIDITYLVKQAINNSKITNGQVLVYNPHTTAAITVNENADPDVKSDILFALNKIYPNFKEFRHFENNSDAHMKSSSFNTSQSFILNNKDLILGIWQGIYFCEFDGPRNRKFYVNIIGV